METELLVQPVIDGESTIITKLIFRSRDSQLVHAFVNLSEQTKNTHVNLVMNNSYKYVKV